MEAPATYKENRFADLNGGRVEGEYSTMESGIETK